MFWDKKKVDEAVETEVTVEQQDTLDNDLYAISYLSKFVTEKRINWWKRKQRRLRN